MFDPLQKILPTAAAKYNFTKQMKAIQICQEYRVLAEKLLPAGVLKETFPQSYDRNILTIGVYNSVWAQTIMMQQHKIMEAINQKFGANTLKKIRITMKELEPKI